MSEPLIQSLEKLFNTDSLSTNSKANGEEDSTNNRATPEDYKLVKNCLTSSGRHAIDFIRANGYDVELRGCRTLDQQFYRRTILPIYISKGNSVIVFNIEVKREYSVRPNPVLNSINTD